MVEVENGGAGAPGQLDRIEWKLDQLLSLVRSGASPVQAAVAGAGAALGVVSDLPRLTTKQHVALQLMMQGATNGEIADVMGISENTAKVHVRTLAKKFGISSRAGVAMRAERMITHIDPDTYKMLSGGLPKDWAETRKEPDPYARLYRDRDRDRDRDKG